MTARPGGTHVTITGYDLVEVTRVYFGSKPATDVQDVSLDEGHSGVSARSQGKGQRDRVQRDRHEPRLQKGCFQVQKEVTPPSSRAQLAHRLRV